MDFKKGMLIAMLVGIAMIGLITSASAMTEKSDISDTISLTKASEPMSLKFGVYAACKITDGHSSSSAYSYGWFFARAHCSLSTGWHVYDGYAWGRTWRGHFSKHFTCRGYGASLYVISYYRYHAEIWRCFS